MQYCKTVTLRQRPRRNGTLSLFLEFYPGYRDPKTMELIRRRSLGIYIYAEPKDQLQKDYNAIMLEKAEAIRCNIFTEIINEKYNFFSKGRTKESFLDYFDDLSKTKHAKWLSSYKHFEKFSHGKCSFDELSVEFCRKFMEYLMDAKSLSTGKPLNRNSAADYWIIFRNALNLAYRDRRINEKIVDFLDYIKWVPTVKESLTIEEVRSLYHTPYPIPIMKKAVIFSCLTGLRRSDIINLRWENVRKYADGGRYIQFICQKTNVQTTVPISDEAYQLILPETNYRVFEGFTKEMSNKDMRVWLKESGITKHITFHCFRHTYASLQMELGTDIYTVQHLLAHKNVSTTQIYVAHASPKTREAANKIRLNSDEDNEKE